MLKNIGKVLEVHQLKNPRLKKNENLFFKQIKTHRHIRLKNWVSKHFHSPPMRIFHVDFESDVRFASEPFTFERC